MEKTDNIYVEYQELRARARGELKRVGRQSPKDFEIDHLIETSRASLSADIADLFDFDVWSRCGAYPPKPRERPVEKVDAT